MPRDGRLFTLLLALAICLHTVRLHLRMLWLTMVLQKPAIARRAVAIELLRRYDQKDSYRRRAPSVASPPLQHTRTRSCSKTHWLRAGSDQRPGYMAREVAAARSAATSNAFNSNIRSERVRLDNTSGVITTLANSTTGSTTVSLENAQDLHEPQLQARRMRRARMVLSGAQLTPPISPTRKPTCPHARYKDAYEYRPKPAKSRQATAGEQQAYNNVYNTPPSISAEKHHSPNLKLSSTAGQSQDDATEGAKEDDSDNSNHTLVNTAEIVVEGVESPTQKRWSAYSPTTRTSSAQSRPKGGLIELRAKTAGPKEQLPTRNQRRDLSLNFPIRPSPSQPRAISPPLQPAACVTSPPRPSADEASAAAQLDAELQYKQRHIFVGTASLHAFLDALETTAPDTTTKPAVIKAFTALASKEQLLARQSSRSPDDWTLVARITPDLADSSSYTVLARVQLGSVSLQQLVDSIPFGACDEASLVGVVEAFKIASHLDAGERRNAGSRARAFRSLLLERSGAGE